MRYFTLTIILLIAFQNSYNQDSFITVYDANGNEAIAYANVSFEELESGKRYFRTTSENGKAENPVQQRAAVAISFMGYKTFSDTIQAGESKTFKLEQDLFSMDQVVVTGTRTPKRLADVPVQTLVISESEILRAGSVSPLEVLTDYIPGIVSTPNAMGNNLRIRGLNSRYILFMVDGERLVPEGAGGNINLDQIDFNNIERVEVVYGAASALYGSDAVGAVINVITKKPLHTLEGGLITSYQSFNTSKTQINLGSNLQKVSLRASAFRNSSDGYKIEDRARSNPYSSYGGSTKFTFSPNRQISLDVTGRAFQDKVFVFPSERSQYNYTDDMERKLTLIGNTTVRSKNEKNILKASINFDKFFKYELNNVVSPTIPEIEKQPHISNLSSRILDTWLNNQKLEIVGGIEHNLQQINTHSSTILGEPNTIKSVNDVSIFSQLQFNLFENLETVIGARYTWHETFHSAFNPKLSLMYKTGRFVFRGTTGTAFRAPDLKELYYDFYHVGGGGFQVIGNPDLTAEKGLYNSLSAEYTKRVFNISVSAYHNHIHNKIGQNMIEEVNPDDSTKLDMNRYYINTSSATLMGIDVNISYVLFREIILKGTYSLCDAVDDETGLPLPSSVRHSGSIAITWNGEVANSPFILQLNGRLHSSILKKYYVEEEGEMQLHDESTKAYNIWKATLTKPFRLKAHLLEFSFKCDNIFDFADNYYINPGRQYLVGIRYKFR
jgi:outer membrane receptor for ferrienterochelin and colicins